MLFRIHALICLVHNVSLYKVVNIQLELSLYFFKVGGIYEIMKILFKEIRGMFHVKPVIFRIELKDPVQLNSTFYIIGVL